MASQRAAASERRLFGTDGVRGAVGELVTAELALGLGRAAAATVAADAPRVLVVRDTRESGEMLEAALAAGVAAAGGHALVAGVLPTPAAACLVRRYRLELAAVVSASHNPSTDNGVKFFGPDGTKLGDAEEARIEAALAEAGSGRPRPNGARAHAREAGRAAVGRPPGRIRELHGGAGDYLRELELRFAGLDLSGRRVLLDCANGAAYRVAPEIFSRLGAHVETVAAEPDGRNINAGCGSTCVDRFAPRVAEGGFDAGFSFDGDADRVLGVDRDGAILDGDELIAVAAPHLRGAGRLPGPGVVVTVMSNYGLHQAMAAAGIEVATTPVGDRHVIEELMRRGWALGGEQSGHVIETGFVPSGDGVAGALLALEAVGDGDLAAGRAMRKLPQRLENVRVADRGALAGADGVWTAVEREQERLGGRGRVLVRPSGTEPLVRVMVEAPEDAECEAVLARLVEAVRGELA